MTQNGLNLAYTLVRIYLNRSVPVKMRFSINSVAVIEFPTWIPSSLVMGTAWTWNSLAVPDFLYNIISTWIRYPYRIFYATLYIHRVQKVQNSTFEIQGSQSWNFNNFRPNCVLATIWITILKCFTVLHSRFNTVNTLLRRFWPFLNSHHFIRSHLYLTLTLTLFDSEKK